MSGPIRMSINQVEYTTVRSGTPIIHLFGRDEQGTLHKVDVSGFRPYFYISKAQSGLEHPDMVTLDAETDYKSIYGNPVLRAYVQRPSDVRDVRDRYTHYEADVTFTSRFLIDSGLTGGVETPADYVDYRELKPISIKSPMRTCILDIECTDEHGFPDADNDEILCLTCWDSFDNTFVTFFYNPSDKRVDITALAIASKGKKICFDPDIHEFHEYKTEKEMLEAFIRYLRDKNPDVLTGWNSVDFDMPYIVRRMEMLGMKTESLGRIPGAVGERGIIRGRSQFDLLAGYRRLKAQQQESYRLDAIAEEELGRKKVHFTGRMCDMWRNDPEKLVEYNFTDVDLCVGINRKNRIVDFFMEVAHYVGCPFEKTMVSSVVVDTYILRKAHGMYVLPSKGQSTEEMFEGALVLEPSLGLKGNVVVFDLTALYPMSMMTLNASPETKDPNGELVAPNGVRFRKSPDGLTRSILAELMAERSKKKAERDKHAPDSDEYKVLDMQQDVLKIIMNTYYGVSGYARFRLYDREIASAVTATGREMIRSTKEIIEKEGYKVIYGDSVGKDTIISINGHEMSYDIRIADLFEEVTYRKDDGREYCVLGDVYTDIVDSSGKLKNCRVKYVMRHKTNKKIYRVWLTNEWYIDVTEDHSIFGYLNRSKSSSSTIDRVVPVKPRDIGRRVKSIVVRKQASHKSAGEMWPSDKLYEFLGYFIGDGSFDRRPGQKNYYLHLAAGDDQQEVIEKLIIPLQKDGYIKSFWAKARGDIALNGKVVGMFEEIRGHKKHVPAFVYTEPIKNVRAVLRGLFSSDGTCIIRPGGPIIRYTTIDRKLAGQIQKLLFHVGISSSIYRETTTNKYHGKDSGTTSYHVHVKDYRRFKDVVGFIEDRKNETLSRACNRIKFNAKEYISGLDFDISSVRRIEEISYDDYVYDIEVDDESHRFFANDILVHNTDSNFCVFPPDTIENTLARAKSLENKLNEFYPAHSKEKLHAEKSYFSIRFQKIYKLFFQAGKKKRYAGNLVYKEGKTLDTIDIVGFEIRRSDTPHIARKVMKDVMEMILRGKTYEEVRQYLRGFIEKYMRGEFSLDEIGIPGGIQKNLDDYENEDSHVRGAKYSNKYLGTGFKRGSKPKRVYIKKVTGKYPAYDVICFEYGDQVPKEFVIDYDIMLDKTIKQPILRIIEPLGWKWENIDPSITTLASWGI